MTTTEDRTAQRTQAAPFSWRFNKADWKSLFVGVIGSLVTLMIVALALTVTRHLGHVRAPTLFYIATTAGPSALFLLAWRANKLGDKVSWLKWLKKLAGALVLIAALALAAIVGFGLLILIGEAAGIR
jgi:phage-related holin